ncbi:MAG: citrate/2-methylcitrate synthase [Peptococcaceae bacterium]|nr:citrate/2-methylcitrate synthase [Peptococcaceae bacterium]
MNRHDFIRITPGVHSLTKKLERNSRIDPALYAEHNVKRGLRDINGQGVVAGLTNIADIHAYEKVDGKVQPCDGKLYYRGYDVEDLVRGIIEDQRFGFEEITYLLLTGDLPSASRLGLFQQEMGRHRTLPDGFVRDIIMEAPANNVMNGLARSILTLYTYDERADDISLPNVMRQCLQLIASFPMLAAYTYCVYDHYHNGNSLVLHVPPKNLSQAETLLYMIRPDKSYTELEARILDLCLIVHADHGGGNNSAFTTRVVTSTGTDTYSAIASALCSLKGPRHGGANIKVRHMFEDLKSHVKDWDSDEEIHRYLDALLDKKAFDHTGLVYGMGHAVYSKSDPRAMVLKDFVYKLSKEKGREDECNLYMKFDKIAGEVIAERRKIYKGVSANVDFYSGFVYDMLNIPEELYTPIFAMARISGWCAHRLEELCQNSKIIRPAYNGIAPRQEYVKIADRRDSLFPPVHMRDK